MFIIYLNGVRPVVCDTILTMVLHYAKRVTKKLLGLNRIIFHILQKRSRGKNEQFRTSFAANFTRRRNHH